MNIAELINQYEQIIAESNQYKGGSAGGRIAQMYIDVAFYLIAKGKLSMSDDRQVFEQYITIYTPPQLYKVSSYYRQQNHLPRLNYKQPYYYERTD